MTTTQWKLVWKEFYRRVSAHERKVFYPSWRLQKKIIEQIVNEKQKKA